MECKDLIHPFQNDPGVSQRQRVMDDLLSGSAKIDGRSLADLLDYFVQLSRHINYYDANLRVTDWQPFFQESLPFTVTKILKYDKDKIGEKLAFYNALFDKRPDKTSLQLLFRYVYHTVIRSMNTWSLKLKNSGLPVELVLDKLIKDKLADPLKLFIVYLNTAVKWYHIKPLGFKEFTDNETWDLDISDVYAVLDKDAFKAKGSNQRKRLITLRNEMLQVVTSFLDVIHVLESSAELSMEHSLFPLKEELKEKHTPHLALLFSFLKLFQHLQGDLNTFTRKHLDFFYKEVLCLRAKDAVPDQVHVVFEIQNQLNKYLLEKGLLLKDGKDSNKAEILFALDDEIVINKTKVADLRTLFINNRIHGKYVYAEGVYMAPDATKADGIDKAFKDDAPASWPTLGAQLSKYTDPEHKFVKPYPNARLGFILLSPVLLLNEGDREVTITLSCQLNERCALIPPESGQSNPCCEAKSEEESDEAAGKEAAAKEDSPDFYKAKDLFASVKTALEQTSYLITEQLIATVLKKKISDDLRKKLEDFLKDEKEKVEKRLCYCPVKKHIVEKRISAAEFDKMATIPEDKVVMLETFKAQKALNILFSGEKEWISPAGLPEINVGDINGENVFNIVIVAKLLPEQKAVTFYNAAVLKEDFKSTLPMVKIELDDRIKLNLDIKGTSREHCLERKSKEGSQDVSLYHFFRNVSIAADRLTKIKVKVCGLKNFIVQNDESIQDVMAPVYPFGTRPAIIDFDAVNPAIPALTQPNLIGPNFYIGSKEVFCKKWNEVNINLDWKDKPTNFKDYYKGYLKGGLDVNNFLINLSVLENGQWKHEKELSPLVTDDFEIQSIKYYDRKLFDSSGASFCDHKNPFQQRLSITKECFVLEQKFQVDNEPFLKYESDVFNGFLRVNLQKQDFCHKVYSYVLARQMMALGRPKENRLEDAVYYDPTNGNLIVFSTDTISANVDIADNKATEVVNEVNAIVPKLGPQGGGPPADIAGSDAEDIRRIVYAPSIPEPANQDLVGDVNALKAKIVDIKGTIATDQAYQAVIPNEPWMPIIKNISIDYIATAEISDIELIHLYPYQNTFKAEKPELQPTLFPAFCEEGSLYLGLKDFEPGSNLNVLFQLAEATADSESQRLEVQWYYLEDNLWKPLRKGFEVLEDDTDGLTTSGIIKFALPANMTNENTILPKGLHWIKVVIPYNSKSVSETMGIFTQAIRATFTNEATNDKLRLAQALPAGSVAKLNVADASIKKVSQPFDAFGGRLPEEEGHFYTRVSELLRHKGRGIQKFDYERLVLEAFPQLFKVKCINHSFALDAHQYTNDIPMAPGYVLLAVIPDMNQLKAAQQFEPRVPVSILEDVQEYLKQRISPFVRLRVMNPRYEKVNFCLKVKLYLGKDENFYKEKLKQDLKEFLAPWAIGEYDKLTFGQRICQSDIIGFLETRDYLDYIIDLKMLHEKEDTDIRYSYFKQIYPLTPRSVLIGGDIDVCIQQQDCEQWGNEKEYPPCTNRAIPIENYCTD